MAGPESTALIQPEAYDIHHALKFPWGVWSVTTEAHKAMQLNPLQEPRAEWPDDMVTDFMPSRLDVVLVGPQEIAELQVGELHFKGRNADPDEPPMVDVAMAVRPGAVAVATGFTISRAAIQVAMEGNFEHAVHTVARQAGIDPEQIENLGVIGPAGKEDYVGHTEQNMSQSLIKVLIESLVVPGSEALIRHDRDKRNSRRLEVLDGAGKVTLGGLGFVAFAGFLLGGPEGAAIAETVGVAGAAAGLLKMRRYLKASFEGADLEEEQRRLKASVAARRMMIDIYNAYSPESFARNMNRAIGDTPEQS